MHTELHVLFIFNRDHVTCHAASCWQYYVVVLGFHSQHLATAPFTAMADVVNHLGIMSWVSAIRTTMANDPGRQILEDQIQNNGILFLEDYLDNIMAGPKHEYASYDVLKLQITYFWI